VQNLQNAPAHHGRLVRLPERALEVGHRRRTKRDQRRRRARGEHRDPEMAHEHRPELRIAKAPRGRERRLPHPRLTIPQQH
jgi:hypothetical protein